MELSSGCCWPGPRWLPSALDYLAEPSELGGAVLYLVPSIPLGYARQVAAGFLQARNQVTVAFGWQFSKRCGGGGDGLFRGCNALITWVGTVLSGDWAEALLIRALADLGASGIDCVAAGCGGGQSLYLRRGVGSVSLAALDPSWSELKRIHLRRRRSV